jgi:hypothetical protein
MTDPNHGAPRSARRRARQARVQRSLNGVVASYIRDISERRPGAADRAQASLTSRPSSVLPAWCAASMASSSRS